MLHLHVAPLTFHKLINYETSILEYVAYSCFKQNKGINEMNDAQAYKMQVKMWKPNTWGVTTVPRVHLHR
jgi:hypothetical protein